jgi:hypothetical protein
MADRSEQQRAFIRFREALHALSDAPTVANLGRYLKASIELDESREATSRSRAGRDERARPTVVATGLAGGGS